MYELDSKFDFGKYKGKTVKQVMEIDVAYLEWCLCYIDTFVLSEEADIAYDIYWENNDNIKGDWGDWR